MIPGGHSKLAIHVEGQGWLERGRWDNFNAAVLVYTLLVIQLLDVIDGVLELLLCWSEYRHLVDQVQLFVGVLSFQQRVLYSLVKQLLLLPLLNFCTRFVVAIPSLDQRRVVNFHWGAYFTPI